jgi:ribosome-associated translation inhibitor RaiA
MKLDRQMHEIVMTGAHKWDPEAVTQLEHRLQTTTHQLGFTDQHMRVSMDRNSHHRHSFGAIVHLTVRRRTLHAEANGDSEWEVISKLDQRVASLLERERQRRWRTRHRQGAESCSRWSTGAES